MSAASLQIRPCPVCDAPDFTFVLKVPDHQSDEDFDVVRCQKCEALYLNPVPPPAEIGRYYDTFTGNIMHHEGNPIFDGLRGFAIATELSPLLKRLAPSEPIADIGTGSGQVAQFLKKRGRAVIARDVFPADQWANEGIPYAQIDLNGPLAEPLPAKGAILRHVLEHVHEPARLLSWLHRSEVRYVFVLVPNTATLLRESFGPMWAYWDPPRHLTFFTPDSLTRVAERAGYRQVASRDHGLDEIVTSIFRAKMLHWVRTPPEKRPPEPWWVPVFNPKGALSAISSALVSPIGSGALCRVFERVA